MRILALDASGAWCSVALVEAGVLLAQRSEEHPRGQSAVLAPMAQAVLADGPLDLVAVTVGPGSFTGLRAALALGLGIGMGRGIPVVAVQVGEALCGALQDTSRKLLATRRLWVAIASGKRRVFLDRAAPHGDFTSCGLDHLPGCEGAVAVAGDAAVAVAARLAARGADVALTDARRVAIMHVATVARRRFAGDLPPLAVRPLYVDPPAVTLPRP